MTAQAVLSRPMPLHRYLHEHRVFAALEKNKCVELPFDPTFLEPRARAIIAGMKSISDDPENAKKLFPFDPYVIDAYGEKYHQEAGYKHETGGGENKHVLQFIKGAPYANGIMGDPLCPTAREHSTVGALLQALSDIHDEMRQVALTFAAHVDDGHGKARPYQGSLYERIYDGTIVIRVIRYPEEHDGVSDAYMHFDRGTLSFALVTTQKGLVIELPSGERIGIDECSYDTICAFFGRKYSAATRNIRDACPHGVKYVRTGIGDRYSIVVFVHSKALPDEAAWLLENNDAIRELQRSFVI